MFKVGIIGMGRVGKSIADLISGDAEVLAVRKHGALTSVAESNPDFKKMIDSKPDCVVFCASEFSSESRKRATSRGVEFEANQYLAKYYMFHFPRDSAFPVFVITNPTDRITTMFVGFGINAYGFGLDVDVYRFSKSLTKSVHVVGSHGRSLPVLNLEGDSENLANCIYTMQKSAEDIGWRNVSLTGQPPLDVAECFAKLVKTLASDNSGIFHLEHPKHPYLGGPYSVSRSEIKPLDIKLTSAEEEVFNLLCR